MLNNPWVSAFIVCVFGLGYMFWVIKHKEGKNKKLVNYTPNVWTALGILGTFMTLFFTLKDDLPMEFTTVNGILIESENIDIKELINQLTSAFSTSIVGILGAIFSSIFIKNYIDKLEKKLEDEKEEKRTKNWENMPFEQILFKTYQENQKLHTTINDNTKNVHGKLDDLYKVIYNSISSINSNADRRFESIIDIDIENLDNQKTVVSLLKQLNSENNEPTKKLANSIEAMDESLQNVSTSINSLMADFKKELSEFTTQIKATTDTTINELNREAIEKAKENAEKASKDFTVAIEAIIKSNEALIVNQNEATKNTQKEILDLQTAILEEVKSKTDKVVTDFKETTQTSISKSNETLEENKTELQAIHNSVKELLTTQKNTFDNQIAGVTTKVGENADEMNTKFTGVLQKMETSLNSLSEKMLTQTQTQLDAQLDLMKISIADNIKSLNDTIQLARSVQSSATITLETTTKEFAGAIEKYADAKDENKDIAEQLQNQLTELQNLLQEQTQLRKSIGSLTEKIETYDTRINDITNTINELGEIKGSLKQLTTKI